jgi:hypothetical protein
MTVSISLADSAAARPVSWCLGASAETGL